ncbi:MAG: PEGA domain-containing protein [Myxococcales bacterium]|nr:PEGA domain-containing protein [Myxococcales bacterium]
MRREVGSQRPSLLVLLALPSLLLCAAGAAWAQSPAAAPSSAPTSAPAADARARGAKLLARGIARFDDGAFAAARALLAQARASLRPGKQRARAELYLGFVHAAENHAAAARAAFARALSDDPALELDPQRHKPALVRMFGEVRKTRVGSLRVESDRADAEVRIDGRPGGKVPYGATLGAGDHEVELLAPDASGKLQLLRRQRVTVAGGATTRLVLAVAPRAGAGVGTRANGNSGAAGGGQRDTTTRRRGRPGVFSYTLAAAALAAAAVAIGIGVSANGDRDDACALLGPQGRCDAQSVVSAADLPRYRELYDRAKSKTLGANISWGIAGGLLAATVVALVLEWRAPLRAEVSVSRHGALAGLRLAY